MILCLKNQSIGRHIEKTGIIPKAKENVRFVQVNVRKLVTLVNNEYRGNFTPNHSVRFRYNLILFSKYKRRNSCNLHKKCSCSNVWVVKWQNDIITKVLPF